VDAATWYFDGDLDGVGDDATAITACEQPLGYVAVGGDCDDADGANFPGNPEVCDSADNNCDGADDEGVPLLTHYADRDGDGHGDPASPLMSCASAVPGYLLGDDTDCDDTEPLAWTGNPEVCFDDVDNDCSGTTDGTDAVDVLLWWPDHDHDGFGDDAGPTGACTLPVGFAAANTDCDDDDQNVFPGATESCNGVDDDCANGVDDGLPTSAFFADADGDGHGDPAAALQLCMVFAGYVSSSDDCNPVDPLAWTGNPEVCDGSDNDCSGNADGADAIGALTWYADADRDGHGDPGSVTVACAAPPGSVLVADDCNDSEALAWTGAIEVCDGVDNDCDGSMDGAGAAGASTWFADVDGDGHGDASNATVACDQPVDTVTLADDCDDGEPLAWTGNPEVCDGADNDCNGTTDGPDASDASTWFADADGDGHGDGGTVTIACDQPADTVADDDTDCDDGEPLAWTGNTEVCDGVDNDCSGEADGADAEGATTWYFDGDGDGFGGLQPTEKACDRPARYVDNSDDCDDANPAFHPGADSVPDNRLDEDCDGQDPTTPVEEGKGCGCETEGSAGSGAIPLLAGLLALRRRRAQR
jgi:MYXO-CTERM domain-containing protein